jgi:hypothetical protein
VKKDAPLSPPSEKSGQWLVTGAAKRQELGIWELGIGYRGSGIGTNPKSLFLQLPNQPFTQSTNYF